MCLVFEHFFFTMFCFGVYSSVSPPGAVCPSRLGPVFPGPHRDTFPDKEISRICSAGGRFPIPLARESNVFPNCRLTGSGRLHSNRLLPTTCVPVQGKRAPTARLPVVAGCLKARYERQAVLIIYAR